MKKILFVLLFTIPFMSFGQKFKKIDEIRTMNRNNVNKISLGMTKSEVMNIMGTESYKTSMGAFSRIVVNNPYKTEILSEGDKKYEVLFYFTNVTELDGLISDDELTPIVFHNGKVDGYGWLYVKDNIKRYSIDMR